MHRNFIKPVLAALAALAASACTYGSMVDIAPMSARLARPAIAPGDYCEVKGEAAPFTVVSHEDCVPVSWDQATRTFTVHDPDEPSEDVQAAVVALGSGLYASQITTPDDKVRHQILVFIAKGSAFSMLSALADEPLKQLAARHKKLTFETDGAGRPYIAAGKLDHIRAFLKDAARESLRQARAEDEDVSIGILDTSGVADHPASQKQQKDIEAVLKAAKSLTPK